jgi:hypothetical protein
LQGSGQSAGFSRGKLISRTSNQSVSSRIIRTRDEWLPHAHQRVSAGRCILISDVACIAYAILITLEVGSYYTLLFPIIPCCFLFYLVVSYSTFTVGYCTGRYSALYPYRLLYLVTTDACLYDVLTYDVSIVSLVWYLPVTNRTPNRAVPLL